MVKVETQLISVDPHDPDPRAIEQAAATIRSGGLVVVPTDTVYGLVCDPGRQEAVDMIYRVKQRGRELPLSLLLHDMAQVAMCVRDVPENAVRVMQQFWPGPLTIIVGSCRELTAPVCAGLQSVGLRLPAHMVPRLVAGQAGVPLASTSANISGRPASHTAEEAYEQLQGLVPLILDAGPAPLGRESTVLSFMVSPPRVLREGALPAARLREVLGEGRAK
jgi:L-threonylcarbamoyladenylate synthase